MEKEKIKYVIFDMDGVLVNSEPVIEAAATAGLKEYGVDAEPSDFEPFIGAGEDRYIGGVAEKYGVPYKKEMKDRVYEIYLEIVGDKIEIFAGVKDILDKLQEDGYQLALASSADMIKVKANLREAGIDRNIFNVIISGDDVNQTKPDPEIYLMTSDKINAGPEECLVIEDSLHGVQSAKKAGMLCAAVTTSFTRKELEKTGVDFIGDNLENIVSWLNI